MPTSKPHIRTHLPPLLLGTAAFNAQYNRNPFTLPTTSIILRALSSALVGGFDTSPYYGPAEILLGQALSSPLLSHIPRSSYVINTKIGRIASAEFDYSPSWIRRSIERSLRRLHTEYLDVVYCHDVEFVTADEVVSAVRTLRELRSAGKVKFIGISGYPVPLLCELAELVRRETGEGLDCVMSYANYTVQNRGLLEDGVVRLKKAGVGCVLNASPLGMGLLRREGVPIGEMGDFHPSSDGLRRVCRDAAEFCEQRGRVLEEVAYRWALESWAEHGGDVGADSADSAGRKIGISVIGVSYLDELEKILETWESVLAARDGDPVAISEREKNEKIVRQLEGVFGEWIGKTWDSPGKDYIRVNPRPERFVSDEELYPALKGGEVHEQRNGIGEKRLVQVEVAQLESSRL